MYAPFFRRTLILGCLSLAVAVPLLAEDEGQPPRPRYHELINIDALIDNHVRLLARRYDLSDEQFAFTEEFLRQSADLFLERNQDVMNGLIDELFDVRAGGDVSPEELMAWGKRALPLYQEAKLMIIEGNSEWREILTDEQKTIHDEDLELMYRNIATTEEQLGRIVTGQMAVEELRGLVPSGRPPRPDPRDLKDPRPAPGEPVTSKTPDRPGTGTTPQRPREKPTGRGHERGGQAGGTRSSGDRTSGRGATSAPTSTEFESEWEKYVREFIEKYKLDDAQSQRAWSILKSCQEQAAKHMKKRKTQLERLDKKIKTLSEPSAKEKGQREELAKLKERRGKLLEPVGRIFEGRLKPRLEKLPTRAQREAAEKAPQAGAKKPERTGKRIRRPKPRTPPESPKPDDSEEEEQREEEQDEEN